MKPEAIIRQWGFILIPPQVRHPSKDGLGDSATRRVRVRDADAIAKNWEVGPELVDEFSSG